MLFRRQRRGQVTTLVLQEMTDVFVGQDAKQPAAARETGGQLEIGDIGAAIGAAQPVLLLGEIVVADAGPMHPAQRRLG